MAALQKFKLLATQCGVAESPTRSPRTSPIVHLPRRKTTLRMLLTRGSSGRRSPRRRHSTDDSLLHAAAPAPPQPIEKRNTLKDLFVSSSPEDLKDDGEFGEREVAGFGGGGGGSGASGVLGGGWRVGSGSPRPMFLRLRYRYLLKKGWRPILSSIPEEILAEIS